MFVIVEADPAPITSPLAVMVPVTATLPLMFMPAGALMSTDHHF